MNTVSASVKSRGKVRAGGFTLLEVLIAIAIFSVVSLASFTIFDTVLRGDENSKIRSERQNELQRAFLLIERDFTQISKRSMRISGEAPSSNFLQTSDDSFLADEQAIAFVSKWLDKSRFTASS